MYVLIYMCLMLTVLLYAMHGWWILDDVYICCMYRIWCAWMCTATTEHCTCFSIPETLFYV